MSLVHVTGSATSGKTAVAEALAERGYAAYDTDDPGHTGLSGWHNLETGEYVAGFNELEVTPELLETHIWRLADGAIPRLQKEAKEQPVYLCGLLRDPNPVVEASRYVVWLATDEETIRERFKLPREVTWGQEEWQIRRTIALNDEREEQFRRLGAIMLDARQPLTQVVNDLVEATSA